MSAFGPLRTLAVRGSLRAGASHGYLRIYHRACSCRDRPGHRRPGDKLAPAPTTSEGRALGLGFATLAELFNLWWRWRGFEGTTTAEVIPYFVALILIYLTASITLPDEVPAEGLNLGRYFDENRSSFWFVYACYVAVIITLMSVRGLHHGLSTGDLWSKYYFDYPWIVVAFGMIFVRQLGSVAPSCS